MNHTKVIETDFPGILHAIRMHLICLRDEGVDAIQVISPPNLVSDAGKADEAASVGSYGSSAESLLRLKLRIGDCRLCKLHRERKNLVYGEGSPNPEIVFVGEGPGYDEDRQGRPFVGAAGQLLDRIINAMGLKREDVYICNVVKCHPPGNRDPENDEIEICGRFLAEQISILNPKIIVCLGRISGRFLTGHDSQAKLWALRGKFFTYNGVDVRVTYHPSAVLRDPRNRRPVWEDMQAVLAHIGRPLPRSNS